jgi:hypothetical protein
MEKKPATQENASANHSHAWRGTWERPMKVDENSLDALTVARMTDHNVRGRDEEVPATEDPDFEDERKTA